MLFGQFLRRSFGDLRHIQLSSDACPWHSSVDIVYCAYTGSSSWSAHVR